MKLDDVNLSCDKCTPTPPNNKSPSISWTLNCSLTQLPKSPLNYTNVYFILVFSVRTTHPGAVVQLVDNPLDANKLLIAYESGQIVLWDLRGKTAEMRWQSAEPLRSVAWHHEGKNFVSSHTDGSLCTWPLRPSPKPVMMSFPHAKTNKEGKLEACKPIHKVDLRTSATGETYTIFSGGLSIEKGGKSPCITVIMGKSTTVLEMEHPVVDFITICESPWASGK